jgi:GT2 family glycosyltransferase
MALRRQTYPSFETIVVDNNSLDGTADHIRRQFPEVRLIETGENLGMVAFNLGFEAAKGEYILVIDDDGLPAREDWISQVVSRFEANPCLGAVCCTIRMRDTGRVAHDSPQFAPNGDGERGYPGVAYNGTGAGLRAEALQQAGLYPWPYFINYLELHLCTRLIDKGWQVRYFPGIEVLHCRPSGSSHPAASYYGLRNYYWYVWQFYPWPTVLAETLHGFGWRCRSVLRGQVSFALHLRSTWDAFSALGHVIGKRQPVSRDTLAYLRTIRRHEDRSGRVAEVVRCKACGQGETG